MVIVTVTGTAFKIEKIMEASEVKPYLDSLKSSGVSGSISIEKV
jgi:hypothetical protein